MKYTVSIQIALPREQVVALLADPAHYPKWLRGLLVHEPISGLPGEVGTTSRVVFQVGTKRLEATETITRREPTNLHRIPQDVVVHFGREVVGMGMRSDVRDRLTEAGPDKTLWESDSEFRFTNVLMRLIGLLLPSSFRKQSLLHMQDFKAFAEEGRDVRDTL